MLSVLKAIIHSSVRPVSNRVWRQVENHVRSFVEARFQSLEEKSEGLRAQATEFQARIAELQARIALLEHNWQEHVPVFLRATSTVVSFERELAKLKDVVLANEKANFSGEGDKTIPRSDAPQTGAES